MAYDSLFESLFATERIPAWHTNRLNRLTRTDKRYVVDPAMLGPLLGISRSNWLGTARTMGSPAADVVRHGFGAITSGYKGMPSTGNESGSS